MIIFWKYVQPNQHGDSTGCFFYVVPPENTYIWWIHSSSLPVSDMYDYWQLYGKDPLTMWWMRHWWLVGNVIKWVISKRKINSSTRTRIIPSSISCFNGSTLA